MAEKKHFMKIIGFSGFDDYTGPGKTILLTLLILLFAWSFFVAVVSELLTAHPAIQDSFRDGLGYLIALSIVTIVAFFAIFWRHVPLIILVSLISAIGIFTMVHEAASEAHTFFPPAFSARFAPSEEELEKIEALRAVRFAVVKTTNNNVNKDAGEIVTIFFDRENKEEPYTIRRMNGEYKTQRINSDFKLLKTDRTVKIFSTGNLKSSQSADSNIIREIRKGEPVTLTGNWSADNNIIEVIYNDDKGWVAKSNIFKLVEKTISDENEAWSLKFSFSYIVIILSVLVLMFILNILRASKIYTNYYKDKKDEYPWLNEWINKNGNPAKLRTFEAVIEKIISVIFWYLVVAFVGGFIAIIICRIIMLDIYVPQNLTAVFLNGGIVLASIIAMIVAWKKWNATIGNPAYISNIYDLGLECPHCGCPHSYYLRSHQFVVDSEITTTTTTRTKGQYMDSTDSYDTKSYAGRKLIDCVCVNCKHEDHIERPKTWDYKYYDAKKPDETPIVFDPPLKLWTFEGAKSSQFFFIIGVVIVVGFIVLCVILG